MKLKEAVEAVLFSATDPINTSKIARICGASGRDVERTIQELMEEYAGRDTALEIVELNGRYLMRVKPEYAEVVKKLVEKDLDRGSLRTLAVIALRQPIALSKLAKIRGNRCYEHVKKLEEMGLVKAEKKGRGTYLTTTRYFASYFGLESDDPDEIRKMLRNYASGDKKLSEYIEG